MAYSSERRVTHHAPYLPPLGQPIKTLEQRRKEERENAAALSRETIARDVALLQALNRESEPNIKPEDIELAQPCLPDDFAQQVAALDEKIYRKGAAFDRDKLLALGRERFRELLALDRPARRWQIPIGPRVDLTSFPSVFCAFANGGALYQVPVPERTMTDQVAGANRELDQIRKVGSFGDL